MQTTFHKWPQPRVRTIVNRIEAKFCRTEWNLCFQPNRPTARCTCGLSTPSVWEVSFPYKGWFFAVGPMLVGAKEQVQEDDDDDKEMIRDIPMLSNTDVTRQHRKALWHNGCPSHNLLRHLTLIHDHDNKRGEAMQE